MKSKHISHGYIKLHTKHHLQNLTIAEFSERSLWF